MNPQTQPQTTGRQANSMERALMVALQAQLHAAPSDRFFAPPILTMGGTGTGKSSCVKTVAKLLTKHFWDIAVPQSMEADFVGYGCPDPENDVMRFLPMLEARRAVEAGPGNSILLLDELADATRSVQSAAHGPLLDKQFGELHIPGLGVVACSNPPSISTTGMSISAPVSNRMVHIPFTMTADEYYTGMTMGWCSPAVVELPKRWKAGIQPIYNNIAQFITKVRPALRQMSDEEVEALGEDAWKPTYSLRSWTHGAVLMAAADAVDDVNMRHTFLAGCVGESVAIEYLTWEKQLDLPDPEMVLAAPSLFQIPARGDQVLATANAVCARVLADNTNRRWSAGWEVLKRLKENGHGDIATLVAPNLASAWPKDARDFPPAMLPFVPLMKKAGLV